MIKHTQSKKLNNVSITNHDATVIPCAAEVYNENLIGINIDNYAGSYSNTVDRIKRDTNTKILYCYDCLKGNKDKGLVYYKTDHHWSQLGAYLVYKLLMNEMQTYDQNIKPSEESNYEIKPKNININLGSLIRCLYLDDEDKKRVYLYDDKYLSFSYKHPNLVYGDNNSLGDDKSHTLIKNKNGNGYKLFLFGDSYIRNFYSFFTHSFSETYCYFKRGQIYMPYFENIIAQYNPDFVVLCVYAANSKCIKNWYDPKYDNDDF